MWNTLVASVCVVMVLHVHVVTSFPDGGSSNPSQEYGPPKGSAVIAKPDTMYGPPKGSTVIAKPDTMYGPPSSSSGTDTMYGVPGFTPGEPLDYYAASASNNDNPQIAPCANNDLTTNKQVVLDFYQNVFGDKRLDLIDRYIAENVINHNPMVLDGRKSLLELLKGPLVQGPPTKVDFKRISAEGDLVWLHSRIPVPALNVTYAIADIFKINCAGMIQEHWDVMQDTNVKTANPHPFF